MFLAQSAESVCAADKASALCDWVFDRTSNEFLARTADALLTRSTKVVLIVLIALVVTVATRRAINRFLRSLRGENVRQRISSLRERAPDLVLTTAGPSTRMEKRADAIGALLRSVSSASIWLVAGVMILGQLGIAVGPLLAGAGVLGVAIGFGSQNLVRDMLSGVFMLIEDQYGVGDVIDTGPATGIVEGISLRTTRVRDVNGTLWHVPNGSIDRVGNMSQQWSRALLDIEVAYDTDLAHARVVIGNVAESVWRDPDWSARVVDRPEVWGVEELGANGIAIRLVVKTLPMAQWEVARELRARLKTAFDEEGIEIPFPQRVVWMRQDGSEAKE